MIAASVAAVATTRRPLAALAVSGSALAAGVLANLLKPLGPHRAPPRAPFADTLIQPFPSGHAAAAAAAAACAVALGGRRLAPLAAVAAAAGGARIATGVHYASDVAAGLVLGAAVGALTGRLLRRG